MKKAIFIGLGTISLVLGILGILLPGLPTTPFLLLASYLFLRSSPKLYKKLIDHPFLGKFIRDYKKDKGLPTKKKRNIIAVIGLMSSLSAFLFVPVFWGKLATLLLGLIGIVVVAWVVPTAGTPTDGPAS